MGVTKKSVSLDAGVAARIQAAAEEDGTTFSTWLSEAAVHQLLLREGLRGVREWETEAGPLTDAERAAADATLDSLLGDSAERAAS